MLYLLKLETKNNTYYKVGYSATEESTKIRMYSYYTATPECYLINTMEGTKKDEKYYHKLMHKSGKRYMTTEWYYKLSEEVIEKILEDFNATYKKFSFNRAIKHTREVRRVSRASIRKVPIGLVSYSTIYFKYLQNIKNGVDVEWDIRQLEHENYKLIDEYYKATGKFSSQINNCKKLLKLHYDFKQIKEEAIKRFELNKIYKQDYVKEVLQNICNDLNIKRKMCTCNIKTIFGKDCVKITRHYIKDNVEVFITIHSFT